MVTVKINLRPDQSRLDICAARSSAVCIYSPGWVKVGLEILGSAFEDVRFAVVDNDDRATAFEIFTFDGSSLSLTELQKIALAEGMNVDGRINFERYAELVSDVVVLSMKDLIRQCVVVGLDETTHYGGYPKGLPRISHTAPVYICNLIGLQFQNCCNSGRLVLHSPKYCPGLLDDLIYTNVVGERRRVYSDVRKAVESGGVTRYVEVGKDEYFDVFAYSRFVANDVILACLAVNDAAARNKQRIHFKFQKYGTGRYAGKYANVIEDLMLPAVVSGLKRLFETHRPEQIESLEFPFFARDPASDLGLHLLCERYGLKCSFGDADALHHLHNAATDPHRVLATTNCADAHAVAGNEMKWLSVDAAIAENLKSRGNIFSACLNEAMRERFLEL